MDRLYQGDGWNGPAMVGAVTIELALEELGQDVTKVVLRGRFDTTGAVHIELPFNTIATEKRRVIVDLSGVSFLSSYAIRVLLVGAKLVKSKGGQLVMVCPENNVAKVLTTAGTSELIPVFPDEGAAVAALSPS